jgi:hypothetical protein
MDTCIQIGVKSGDTSGMGAATALPFARHSMPVDMLDTHAVGAEPGATYVTSQAHRINEGAPF